MLENIWIILRHMQFSDVLDILLVAFILYSIMVLIKDTKAYQLATGIILVIFFFLFTQWAHLYVSNRIIRSFINYLIIAIIVLFQSELRRFFTGIGSHTFRRPLKLRPLKEKLEDISLAVDYMSQKKIGALIAIERDIDLSPYAQHGTILDADLSKDLLVSIFFPKSPLHDGAVLIRGNKILAAGCLLPLAHTHTLGENFATRTRHLAALGLAQETDAVVIVVSEQTGEVSLASRGKIEKLSKKDSVQEKLAEYLRIK
ncbi:MAG TPA: diadenylate cyclase CdaA [Candidatus Saccharicenans sp.]|jgi:diadenylate cyclase|nr:diadenylate cyclase CdaA [Candidatus Saccharicenans sp.]HOL45752.1 diadenylate cyclase CdaA [Candidatus Saccharicenans sp.]HOM93558.1 diadenylate cyclase CdaA [Candidatus Saccharicenans sp.]HOP61304.1 diadenylate cyclase CdaA [Candidatus Saccharicenans sp.]HOT68886.1 diadenylate cyclase CdaA [Candidatus Saccharicenans sp.]